MAGNGTSRRIRAARALAASGAGTLLRRLGVWRGVVVLNHHRIGDWEHTQFDPTLWSASPEQLDAQARFLSRHCDVILPDELDEALAHRGRHVMITFDDGYRDNFDNAFPILRSHGLRACFFVTTGFIDEPRASWWDEIAWMVGRCSRATLDVRPWLADPLPLAPRDAAIRALTSAYKELPAAEAERFLDAVAEATGSGRCGVAAAAGEWMTWPMVRELHAGGMAIGGHTVNHPVLSQLPPERQAEEIAGCRARLEAELEEPMRLFSYPNGQRSSFDAHTRALLREHGVRLAFSYYGGYQAPGALDRYDVPRTTVDPTTSEDVLAAIVALPQLFARA